MSRNLTARFLAETERAIANVVCISDVTRIARVIGGYRFTRAQGALVARRAFTESELAWFRRPLGG